MRVVCTHCQNKFETADEDPRCPVCLRKRAVPASGKQRRPPLGLNTIQGSGEELVGRRAEPPRPLSARVGRFFARAAIGALVFALLTSGGTLLGMPLGGAGFQLFAVVLGGLLLGAGWSMFPGTSPIFRGD